jgi:hypothetical protein
MENLDFVLWMIFYPLSTIISDYISHLKKPNKVYEESTEIIYSLFCVFLWFYVGYLLY